MLPTLPYRILGFRRDQSAINTNDTNDTNLIILLQPYRSQQSCISVYGTKSLALLGTSSSFPSSYQS